jgi:hypothetical protein
LSALAMTVLAVASCKENDLPLYNDVSRVYFYWMSIDKTGEVKTNTLSVSLGYDDPIKTDSIISIPINTMGLPSNIDRPVAAEVIKTESTAIPGEDIEIVSGIIPAGKSWGELRVKIINSDKLKDKVCRARIRLLPNEHFHTDWTLNWTGNVTYDTNGSEFNLLFDSMNDMPNLWKDAYSYMEVIWGPWSREKEKVIYECLGFDRSFFTYDPATEVASVVFSRRLGDLGNSLRSIVNRYLRDYKDSHNGEPMRDENGEEIKMHSNEM